MTKNIPQDRRQGQDIPMRIIQVLISPDPGGVRALAESIARGLEEKGFTVETCHIVPDPQASYAARLIGAAKATWRIVSGRYDAMIGYQPSTSILVGVLGALLRNPRRIVHQTTVPTETRAPMRVIDRFVGSIGAYRCNVANTVFTRDQYAAYPCSYRDRMVLIEHGIAPPRPRAGRAEILARHGVPDDGTILLNTGRLVEEKNQEVLMRAMQTLPGTRLVIAGEGSMRRTLTDLARQLGITDRVHFLGALPHADSLDLYAAADIFVFPSLHETFGISGVEAVMCGLPTIASDIDVLREVLSVGGKSTVRFAPPHSAQAWRTALEGMIATPPTAEELDDFATAMTRKYSEQTMIESYVRLLRGEGPSAKAHATEVTP